LRVCISGLCVTSLTAPPPPAVPSRADSCRRRLSIVAPFSAVTWVDSSLSRPVSTSSRSSAEVMPLARWNIASRRWTS
jgi:hypothetical protein